MYLQYTVLGKQLSNSGGKAICHIKNIYILIVQNKNTLSKGKKLTFPEFIDNIGTPPVVICCM
jgi:hypothetical protein